MKQLVILLILAIFQLSLFSQSLEDLVDEEYDENTKNSTTFATFKSVRLINSHTIKNPAQNEFKILFQHRFGYLNEGFSEMFGLDNANIRIGMEYGITDNITAGFGRSTFNKNYDVYGRLKVLKQIEGGMPLSLSVLGVTNISSIKNPGNFGDEYLFSHRINYTAQLLIAKKFSNAFSLQLMPTYLHHNLVATPNDVNDIFAIGIGGRIKITNRIAFTYEYHYNLPEMKSENTYDPLSVGFDIETGGHVFQLFLTNASATYDTGFISQTDSDWRNNEIRFGFNLLRVF